MGASLSTSSGEIVWLIACQYGYETTRWMVQNALLALVSTLKAFQLVTETTRDTHSHTFIHIHLIYKMCTHASIATSLKWIKEFSYKLRTHFKILPFNSLKVYWGSYLDASIRYQYESSIVKSGYSTRPTPDPTSQRKLTLPLRISIARKSI